MSETDAPASDTPDEAKAPAPRVPNVRPGAVSGLDHAPLNPNPETPARKSYGVEDFDVLPDEDDETESVTVPAGTLEERLAWVSEADEDGERRARADAIWKHEETTDPDGDHAELAERLRAAVYTRDDSVEADDLDVPNASIEEITAWIERAKDNDEKADRATAARSALDDSLTRDQSEEDAKLRRVTLGLLDETYGGIIAPRPVPTSEEAETPDTPQEDGAATTVDSVEDGDDAAQGPDSPQG